MAVEKLVEQVCDSLEKCSVDYEELRKKNEKEYDESIEALKGHVTEEFKNYLIEHPEIPQEDYVAVIGIRDYGANDSEWIIDENKRELITPENMLVSIVIGTAEETGAWGSATEDTLELYANDVTKKFKDFVEINRPLEISVLRFFDTTEIRENKPTAFYGSPSQYNHTNVHL